MAELLGQRFGKGLAGLAGKHKHRDRASRQQLRSLLATTGSLSEEGLSHVQYWLSLRVTESQKVSKLCKF